jgi:hypothetical protein
MLQENLTKASQTAGLLFQDLQDAQRDADSPALQILLCDMIEAMAKIRDRLNWLAI